MSENQPGPENKSDDLDLLNLFEKTFTFFRDYGRLIALFSIIGMLIGFAIFKTASKLYSSTILLHSFTLTNTEQINIIENWGELLKGEEYAVLAERLNCDPETIKKIKKIRAAEIQKLYIPNNPNGFMVEVWVEDNTVLDSLNRAFVYGLENSDYIKAKLANRRANLAQLYDKVNAEIIKLDLTKKYIEQNIHNNSQHSASYIIDISSINGQMITLNEKLLAYQDELKFSNAVQILHKFEKFEKPVSPKFFKSIVLGLVGGFAFGYMLSLYLYLRKRITRNTRK